MSSTNGLKYILNESTRSKKKWMITVMDDGTKIKTLHFGQFGASDFTKHKDEERRKRYWARHAGNPEDGYTTSRREDWTDPSTKGFWSRWLTWNLPTIDQSINDIRRRFGINVAYNTISNIMPSI